MEADHIEILDDVIRCRLFQDLESFCKKVQVSRLDNANGKHWIADANALRKVDPSMVVWLTCVAISAAARAGFDHITTSPWRRSSISLKEYRPGDFQTEHLDTNTISAMICVAHPDRGGDTVFEDGRRIVARRNRVAVFPGSVLRHRVAEIEEGTKVVFIVNLYDTSLPIERPAGTDELVYG